ncbi:uncharacterized protein LOC113521063 isoform X2 [Galleria mellonella]|nr:uncharacterized protein LOC113521063 isoform X2 [Galleria mellonella]XP_052750971.1 uncharacterized protein LOC113521063 isoform X2 [Galleria mellonella]
MKFWRDKKTYLRRLEERRALAVKSGATVFPLCALDDRLLQLAKENDKFLLAKTVALPLEMAPSDPLSDEITHNNIIGHEPFIEKEEKLEEDSSPPYSPSLPMADASTAPSELSFPPETAAPHTNKNFEEIRSFERRAFRRNKTRKRSSSGFKQDQFYDMFERITALEEKRLEIDQINAQTNREAVVTAQRCAQAMEALADAIKTQGQEIADALKTNGNLIADALRAQGQIIAESISNKVL